MILGRISVTRSAVVTHRDSYLLTNLSVVSVRRPLLAPALVIGSALSLNTLVFADLLYAPEIGATMIACALMLGLGWQLGQLKLLSRDLRGSELSGAIWGRYACLQTARTQVVAALDPDHRESAA